VSARPDGWRYGELTRDDIVAAGVAIAARDGLGSLTMRKLAAELGVSSMNAYHHVGSKAEVLDLVADAVLGMVPVPPDDLAWDERLVRLFLDGRRLLLAHPGVSDHLLVRAVGHEHTARLRDLTGAILRSAGFDRRTVERTQLTLASLLMGAVSTELATAAAADRPSTVRHADDAGTFEFGLRTLLAGLGARSG